MTERTAPERTAPPMLRTPQLLLTLSPSGDLQAELPGPNGARRVLPLRGTPESTISAIHRILHAQRNATGLSDLFLGTDAAPTSHQVSHWTHSTPRERCPFCVLGLRHAKKFCSTPQTHGQTKPRPRGAAQPRTLNFADMGLLEEPSV